MDIATLMMMQQMQGMNGQQQMGAPTAQPPGPEFRTGGGTPVSGGLLGVPLFGASAYRDMGDWGGPAPDKAVPADSLLNMAHRVKNPTFMDKLARGWNGFGQALDSMDPMMRYGMAAEGLSNLGRVLSRRG